VNTLLIHRADMFGLAQLYQLRGRVGRGKLRAYAYLTWPDRTVEPAAQKRLEVMQTLDNLGAGFTLASHDLDIRGAGNLLGEEQSGQIREVGIELYQQMLEEAVADIKAGQGRDGAGRTRLDAADQPRPAGADPGGLCRRPAGAPRPLSPHRRARLAPRRRLRGRARRPLRPLPPEVENLLEVRRRSSGCAARRASRSSMPVPRAGEADGGSREDRGLNRLRSGTA
jgi:hypothetical protein